MCGIERMREAMFPEFVIGGGTAKQSIFVYGAISAESMHQYRLSILGKGDRALQPIAPSTCKTIEITRITFERNSKKTVSTEPQS